MNGYVATFNYQDRNEDVPLSASSMKEALGEAFALIADKPEISGFSVTRLEKNPEPQPETL